MNRQPIGLYVHVPFCAVKCPYCDFYSLPYRAADANAYLQAVGAEMERSAELGRKADTLYFGGGTPSLLFPQQVEKVVETAVRLFAFEGEITMEANPNTVNPTRLKEYRRAGINRISFGMQSGNAAELTALGRKHTVEQALSAVWMAANAGIEDISLDLMLGTPYQTAESLRQTLSLLKGLSVTHISAYMLKVEENTPYWENPLLVACADDDMLADLYLLCCETLEEMGFLQYEISNFALPGRESRHNCKYWRCEEYLGFGPAAHSFLDGRRFCNPSDLQRYLQAPGENAVVTDSAAGSPEERIMLGLRLREGIPLSLADSLSPRAKRTFYLQAANCEKAGLLRQTDDRLALTRKGCLVSNAVLAELLRDSDV